MTRFYDAPSPSGKRILTAPDVQQPPEMPALERKQPKRWARTQKVVDAFIEGMNYLGPYRRYS